jgi:hypothetical protein
MILALSPGSRPRKSSRLLSGAALALPSLHHDPQMRERLHFLVRHSWRRYRPSGTAPMMRICQSLMPMRVAGSSDAYRGPADAAGTSTSGTRIS